MRIRFRADSTFACRLFELCLDVYGLLQNAPCSATVARLDRAQTGPPGPPRRPEKGHVWETFGAQALDLGEGLWPRTGGAIPCTRVGVERVKAPESKGESTVMYKVFRFCVDKTPSRLGMELHSPCLTSNCPATGSAPPTPVASQARPAPLLGAPAPPSARCASPSAASPPLSGRAGARRARGGGGEAADGHMCHSPARAPPLRGPGPFAGPGARGGAPEGASWAPFRASEGASLAGPRGRRDLCGNGRLRCRRG
eukprot:scaffold2551_cov376-Prasinococcus_capsulatus_cf.AAC.1